MGQIQSNSRRWDLETLEDRMLLSSVYGADVESAAAKGGGAAPALAIKLEMVALHELGHSLGLEHDASETVSIMDPYYNDTYDINYFISGTDPAVAKLRAIYADVNASGWKDSLDENPNDGQIELTYSFVPDGTRMDKGTSTTFKSFDSLYGNSATWQTIIVAQLQAWTQVSENKLVFSQTSDNGAAFNTRGKVQNDPRFGDIRIAAHRFDGAGKVLAHAYYPPPNGETAAGDLHLDETENWNGLRSVATSKAAPTQATEEIGNMEASNPPEVFARQPIVATSSDMRVGASLFADQLDGVFGKADDVM